MTTRSSWVGLLVLAFAMGVFDYSVNSVNMQAADERSREPELRVKVRPEKAVYRLGEELCLEISLMNAGSKTTYVDGRLGWNVLSGLDLQVYDAMGNETQWSDVLYEDLLPPPTDRSDFVRLEPGRFYGEVNCWPSEHVTLRAGETYTIVVQYVSPPDSKEFTFGLDVWPRNKGWIRSEPVQIVVVAAK